MLVRLAWGSRAEPEISLWRPLSRESNREATTCGFCFSANCTASFSVRGIVRGGPGADWASPPSQKTANNDSRQTIDAIRHGGASAFVLVLMLSTISTQRYVACRRPKMRLADPQSFLRHRAWYAVRVCPSGDTPSADRPLSSDGVATPRKVAFQHKIVRHRSREPVSFCIPT
jgi:hypothetical protein